MNKRIFSLMITTIAFILLLGSGCAAPTSEQTVEQPDTPIPANSTPIPTDTNEPTPTLTASASATYTLTFDALWSVDTHPNAFDASAHFSPFIAYTYDSTNEGKIFLPGDLASAGMEEMAETGATTLLEGEIDVLIAAGRVGTFTKGQRIDSPGVDTGELELSQTYSHVIFVSMIAPSPDWFVATDINLFENGQWVEELEIPLVSYDSGTDSGITLSALDSDTIPEELISVLGDGLQNMGTLTFNKVN